MTTPSLAEALDIVDAALSKARGLKLQPLTATVLHPGSHRTSRQGLQSRVLILDQLQTELKSPVLSYVTGDRPGLGTQIASDQLLRFPRHLAALQDHEQLNLVLYTRGGETDAVWPIMSFLREHCKKLKISST